MRERFARLAVLVPLLLAGSSFAAEPLAPSGGRDGQQGNGKGTQNGGSKQDPVSREIQRLGKLLTTSGPESRPEREGAVHKLLSMTDSRAHDLLRARLQQAARTAIEKDPDEPGQVPSFLLRQLRLKLDNDMDAVFGAESSRLRLRREYFHSLVQFFAKPGRADRRGAAPGPGGSRGQVPAHENHALLRRLARKCLCEYRAAELRASLQLVLQQKNVSLRQGAVRAVGEARNIGVASDLAALLSDAALGARARKALENLTYESFSDLAAFQSWVAKNPDQRYVDLVEEAARGGRRRVNEKAKHYADQWRKTKRELIAALVQSTAKSRWREIRKNLFANEPVGILRDGLQVLRKRLPGLELQNGADGADRLAFLGELRKRLTGMEAPEIQALLLEVSSYLVDPKDKSELVAQEKLLHAHLVPKAGTVVPQVVTLACLRGIRRFPGVQNRGIVGEVARTALAAKDSALVMAALNTMKSARWVAPSAKDADAKAWMTFLSGMVLDQDLSTQLRKEALPVFCRRDASDGHPEPVLKVLVQLLSDAEQDATVRQAALIELPDLAKGAEHADLYVRSLIKLLADKDERIRRDVATQLLRHGEKLAKNVSQEMRDAWGQLLLERLSFDSRLGKEDRPRVFQTLVRTLGRLAVWNPKQAQPAGMRLIDAIEKIHAAGREEDQFKLNELQDELVVLVGNAGRSVIERVRAGETLVKIGNRDAAVRVIPTTGVDLMKEPPEVLERLHQLSLQTALLWKDARADHNVWADDKNRPEALRVVQALDWLTKNKKTVADDAATRMLHLSCLSSMGRHQDVVGLCEAWLADSDKVLAGDDRAWAKLLHATALVGTKKPKAAGQALATLGKALPKQRLALQERIVKALLDAVQVGDATRHAEDLLQNTDKKDKAWPRRLVLFVEAASRNGADATKKAILLKQLNDGLGQAVPAPLKDRVEKLRKDLAD